MSLILDVAYAEDIDGAGDDDEDDDATDIQLALRSGSCKHAIRRAAFDPARAASTMSSSDQQCHEQL